MADETKPQVKLYFSDFFDVAPSLIESYGAFNISLLSDLPLFIDPFLLFNSKKPEYQALHDTMIRYLRFLRDKSSERLLESGLIKALYTFPEVSQNWFGFAEIGNKGSGLGLRFAQALHRNLGRVFHDFGDDEATNGSHLEELCLIERGVGRDNISDFTTNLIKGFLLEYTQTFAERFIKPKFHRRFLVKKVCFNYKTESWENQTFVLPFFNSDFVVLTPKDMLSRDVAWINKDDLLNEFEAVSDAVQNDQLRAQINNYFMKVLPEDATKKERKEAVMRTIRKFPELINAFIQSKERRGDQAVKSSSLKVKKSEDLYLRNFRELVGLLCDSSDFYSVDGNTYDQSLKRVHFLKDVIENKGGHRLFYVKGEPLRREADLHIMYRLTWFATSADVSREVNDGRGPADFKISEGSADKSIVEFKLASNSQLERNLAHQTKIYQKASDASNSIKVIIFFSEEEEERTKKILKRLRLKGRADVVLIDARSDNKSSGSKAA
jgi:hypothetical protein